MIPQHGTLEISRSRLAHNIKVLRRRIGPAGICATVKAEAYGHGLREICELLPDNGVQWACVYSLREAQSVATWGQKKLKVLALAPWKVGETEPELLGASLDDWVPQIRVTVSGDDYLLLLDMLAETKYGYRNGHPPISVHVQIDTGLTRGGADAGALAELAGSIQVHQGLRLEGLFMHLSHGDVPGHESIDQQIDAFLTAALPVKEKLPELLLHAQNSGGAWHCSRKLSRHFDMVRIGIAMYGLQPSAENPIAHLKPVARLVAPILHIHRRPAGTGVGYGHTFITTRPSVLAVVPVGYADGYPRAMSNRGIVQIDGNSAPVAGRVSMDQIVVDVTDLPADSVQNGRQVTVISNDPAAPNCIDAIAAACGTIGYEIATGLGQRLARRVVE